MQKSIRDSLMKQQREAKDLGQFRKQRLFQNICKQNISGAGEENIYTSQSEGHQLYDAHVKKMKQAKQKTIEDVQKDRANPIGVDRKKIIKSNKILHQIDKKEKQLVESSFLKQQVINKQPVDMYGAKESQFYYDSVEIRSLNEFMFFYEILKRIKAEKLHEEQRALFKAKLQKIWELEAQANNRGIPFDAELLFKEENEEQLEKASRIQSASSNNNSGLKISVLNESPKADLNPHHFKSIPNDSPAEFKQDNVLQPQFISQTTTAAQERQKSHIRHQSGRMGLTQRVQELKKREALQLKQLSIHSHKEVKTTGGEKHPNINVNEIDPIQNKGNKVDQNVGTEEFHMPTSTKSAKNLKEMFSGTSKFMTMKQADIQLVELLEKIRSKTKTKEKKDKTQNLIVPGMKKGFNAQDINNVVDQAIVRAERTKYINSVQSFTTLDQNNLKVPIVNRLQQRVTDIIQRDKDSIHVKRNASDVIPFEDNTEQMRRDSQDSNKLFRISSAKPTSMIKLMEGIRNSSPPSKNRVMTADDNRQGRDNNLLNPIQEDESGNVPKIRKSSLLLAAGIISKEASQHLLSSPLFSGPAITEPSATTNNRIPSQEKNPKISFQIKITKEEDIINEKVQEEEIESAKVRMSELIDQSHPQNIDRLNLLELKQNVSNFSNISNVKITKVTSTFVQNDEEANDLIQVNADLNTISNRQPIHHSVQNEQYEQTKLSKRSSLDYLDRGSQQFLSIPQNAKKNTDRHSLDHSMPDLDQSQSPQKMMQLFKTKSQTSQSNLLMPNRDSPGQRNQSYRDMSMTFTKKEIDKFDIEKRILQNLDKIGKQLRIQKKVDLPQKIQSRSRLKRKSIEEQKQKHPFKFSPQFVSNWVDLRAKIEQKFDIPSKFHVHKILNQRIRELKHQKLLSNSADNSFYIYQPEYTTYYL